MITLVIKKEILPDWLSFKTFIEVPKIFYRIVKFYWKIKGYEVEVIKDAWTLEREFSFKKISQRI